MIIMGDVNGRLKGSRDEIFENQQGKTWANLDDFNNIHILMGRQYQLESGRVCQMIIKVY